MKYVFVYGSLRKGGEFDLSQLGKQIGTTPILIGEAQIKGQLYLMENYPGIILEGNENDWVKGEIYAICDKTENYLDQIEGLIEGFYPETYDEYFKKEQDVQVNGVWIKCLIYEMNKKHLILDNKLETGDWFSFQLLKSI